MRFWDVVNYLLIYLSYIFHLSIYLVIPGNKGIGIEARQRKFLYYTPALVGAGGGPRHLTCATYAGGNLKWPPPAVTAYVKWRNPLYPAISHTDVGGVKIMSHSHALFLRRCRKIGRRGNRFPPPGIPKWSGAPPWQTGAPPPKSEMLLLGAIFEKKIWKLALRAPLWKFPFLRPWVELWKV